MEPDKWMQPSTLIPVAGGAVIVLGILFAIFKSIMGNKTKGAVEQWARGAYGLWTGGEDSSTWDLARAQTSLKSWYGVQGGPGFWKMLDGLREGAQTGNVAWDSVRAIDLLRIGMAATYIDADQCRTEVVKFGSDLQRRYPNWEELAKGFEKGMNEWQARSGTTDLVQLGKVQANLPTLRKNVWPSIPYATTLVAED